MEFRLWGVLENDFGGGGRKRSLEISSYGDPCPFREFFENGIGGPDARPPPPCGRGDDNVATFGILVSC